MWKSAGRFSEHIQYTCNVDGLVHRYVMIFCHTLGRNCAHTLLERRDTRPPQRAQNFVWQYEQRWPQPSANLVLWQIPQMGASPFCWGAVWASSAIFFTWSLYDSNCWCSFLQRKCKAACEKHNIIRILMLHNNNILILMFIGLIR